MFAGQLRHLVTIQSYVENKDSTGQPIRSYSTFADNVWARVSPLRGLEMNRANEKFAVATTEIEIRYLPGVEETMRVLHENTFYDIIDVLDVDMRHINMILTCKSGLSDEA